MSYPRRFVWENSDDFRLQSHYNDDGQCVSASFGQAGGIVKKKQEPRQFSREVELLASLSEAVRHARSGERHAPSRVEYGFCNRVARFCKKVAARFRLK